MAASVLILTTPTSGTGSLFRTVTEIAAGQYKPLQWIENFYEQGKLDEVIKSIPPPDGQLLIHNTPQFFNPATRLSDYRFILNTRDPRDLVCNQFHWNLVHPNPDETEDETARRRDSLRQEGIDSFALRANNSKYYSSFIEIVRRIPPDKRIFVGYAMYCLHFDVVLTRLLGFFGVPAHSLKRRQLKRINAERVENLDNNPSWIGHQWAGADRGPGRYKLELEPHTIRILTERYAWCLEFLRLMDDPMVVSSYD